MNKENENIKLVPQLRFPEFETDGEWRLEDVDNLSETVTAGGTPSTKKEDYWGGNIRWMNSGELNLKIVSEVEGRITEKGLKNSSTKIIPENCVLIGLAGQGKTRGTVAINKVELCTNQSIASIFPNDDVFDSSYLYHNLDNRYNELRELSAGGSGRGGLNLKIIKEIKIPIPPERTEQQKIAATLTSLDQLITAENEKLEALQDHKKGLLQQLFPAKGSTVPKVRFGEFSGEWEETTLGEVCNYFKGFAFKSKDYTNSGRRIIRVSDMGYDYIKDVAKAIYIKKEDAGLYKKWMLHENDLIITTVGSKPPVYDSLVGRSIVVSKQNENSLLNQNAVCLRANQNIQQSFLNTLFKRKEYISFIESIIRGNANQGSIALVDLFKYPLWKPSLNEQNKIADCLSCLDDLVASVSYKIVALKEHKKGLMQQMFPNLKSNRL